MFPQDAQNLLTRYVAGQCSEYEISVIHTWYNEMTQQATYPEELSLDENAMADTWNVLMAKCDKIRRRRNYWRFGYKVVTTAAAAVVIFGIVKLTVKYLSNSHHKNAMVAVNDIPPGSNKGMLVLANGMQIDLQSAANGQLAFLNGVSINKKDNQIICQRIQSDDKGNTTAMNILNVPNAGQYSIMLEDGSMVKLNAGSSLRFPTSFAGKRNITLSGEAFFEVSKDAKRPFEVKSDNQLVKVLGTRFNVSAYKDENVVTTLVDGKVDVRNESTGLSKSLTPGKQLTLNEQQSLVKKVDPDEAIGWTTGLFIFNETPLSQALKEIGRWYDVEIDMTGINGNKLISAQLHRNNSLFRILENIQKATGVKLKIEARTVKAG